VEYLYIYNIIRVLYMSSDSAAHTHTFYLYILFNGSCVLRLNYDKTYRGVMSTFGIFPFISQAFPRQHTRVHAHATK